MIHITNTLFIQCKVSIDLVLAKSPLLHAKGCVPYIKSLISSIKANKNNCLLNEVINCKLYIMLAFKASVLNFILLLKFILNTVSVTRKVYDLNKS